MNSRERVIAAIEKKNPDRVPVDLGGTYVTTILVGAYYRLLKHLKIEKPVRVVDSMQMLAHVDEEISNRYNTDVLCVWPLRDLLGYRRDKPLKDWTTPTGIPVKITSDFTPQQNEDGSYTLVAGGAVYKLPSNGFYFDCIQPGYSWVETTADVEKIEYPIMDEEEKQWLKINAVKLRNETDKFIVGEILGGWNDLAAPMLGNQKFYMDLVLNPKMVHALFEKLNYVWMRRVDEVMETVGDNIDAFPMYNDLGSNLGGLYKTETVREIFIPYIKKFYEYVRTKTNYKIILHSCGSIYQYLPDLMDAGVDIINPVQVGTKDMNPTKLKREFGKELTFWGGAIDPQHEFAFGSPDEVYNKAKQNIENFKTKGGFVFTQPHNIQANVPPENIEALYTAGNDFGSY